MKTYNFIYLYWYKKCPEGIPGHKLEQYATHHDTFSGFSDEAPSFPDKAHIPVTVP